MPICTLPEIQKQLPPKMRLLALDIGDKNIGLAISDPGLKVASPLDIIRVKNNETTLRTLEKLIKERGIGGLIIGLPLHMNGDEGERCKIARNFGKKVEKRMPELLIHFYDERLSSVAAERALLEADLSRKRRKEVIDKMAASIFLQAALDSLPI